MNPQSAPPDWLDHFIHQHPELFIIFFAVYFVAFWLLIGTIISLAGGWFSLSRRYRTRVPFVGYKWKRQSGRMRLWINYNNVLTLGANQDGLYLASMFLFRFMQPPLFIPWNEMAIRRSKGWIFEYVTFMMGRELGIPLKIRAKLADRLRTDAGNNWPVEDI